MGLAYMPIRPGVVPGGSIDRQSYGSPMGRLSEPSSTGLTFVPNTEGMACFLTGVVVNSG